MTVFRRGVLLATLPILAVPPSFIPQVLAQRAPDNVIQRGLQERAQEDQRRARHVAQAQPTQPPRGESARQSAAASTSPVTQCDNLAGHPDDPQRRAAGVADENIDLAAALQECTRAAPLAQTADSARISFQTGRVLWLAEEFDEAMPFLLDAAEAKEPAALAYIGDAYANGLGGVSEDLETALAFYTQAAAAGFRPADAMADELAKELAATDTAPSQITAVTAQQVNECDRLAAHPSDPRKIGPGVPDATFDSAKAVSACAAATAKFPGITRLDYQYGRSLYLAGRQDEALPVLAGAAERGSAAAKALIGDAYLEGAGGVDQDIGAAYAFYQEASAGGFTPASANAAQLKKALAETPTTPSASSKMVLKCEVLATLSSAQEILQYITFKFNIVADFGLSTAKFSGDIPAYVNNTLYTIGQSYVYSLSEDGSVMYIPVNLFGPTGEGNSLRLNFDDGKITMQQRFEMNRFFNFPVYNFMSFEGYCGEAANTPSVKKKSAKRK